MGQASGSAWASGLGLWLRLDVSTQTQIAAPLDRSDLLDPSSWPDGAGHFESPRISFHAESLSIAPDAASLTLTGGRVALSIPSWNIKKGPFFEMSCQGILAQLTLPATQALPLPDQLGGELRVADDGTVSTAGMDLSSALDRGLSFVWSKDFLQRSLSLQGDCPGDTLSVVRDILIARLDSLPTKDPELWKKVTAQVQSSTEDFLQRNLVKVSPLIARLAQQAPTSTGLQSGLHLSIAQLKGEAAWMLSVTPISAKDSAPPLSDAALKLWSVGRPLTGSRLSFLMSPELLSAGASLAMDGLAQLQIPMTFSSKDFAAYAPELANKPDFHLRLALSKCEAVQAARVIPSISPNGLTMGLHVQSAFVLNFIDADSGQQIFRRAVPLEFWLTRSRFANSSQSLMGWEFGGGRWMDTATGFESFCPEQKLSPELGLSVDWLLRSDALKSFLASSVVPSLGVKPGSGLWKLGFRVLGSGHPEPLWSGDLPAEALVLETPTF